MKKPTTFKKELIVLLIFLFSLQLFAQNQVPFTPRFNQDLKGDIVLIGNNILGPNNNDFNNNSTYNHTVNMRYIDIDSDATTFSSSSADLAIPINPNIPPAANSCYEVVHAGLYWSAVTSGTESITDVKLRGPSGGYVDIVADDTIFNAGGTSVDGGNSFPYACYADVTNIIRALGTDQGTYTVANVSSAEGQTDTFIPRNGTGYSAGWSLFIVYQNPSYPGKSITSFDGFSTITSASNPTVDVAVSGFRTVPAPAPVRANFAFAALEGDKPITGDRLRINGTSLSDLNRATNNFFNSSVTGPPVRQPNSSNALGFDTGILAIPNPSNTVIANNDTSATVRLESTGDTYFPYFFAFAVDIIAPNMVLTKTVEDSSGNNIGGGLVNLGEELNYVIGFQNTGNDDATGLTIRDILPTNIEFNYPADIGLLPPGVTVQSYNAGTRELIFAVDDSVIEENDPILEIRFKVTVVRECSLLNNACDNVVSNQAFSTYRGTLNPLFVISDDPSYSTNTGCLITPGATNFLADINCTFEEDVILCGDNVVLTAGADYDTYSWSTSPSGTPVIGTTQSITVTTADTYYVRNTATAPCQSIDQIFNVITYGAGVTNPVIPFADQVVTCPNDGKALPNIFMCGANDTTFIDTNITDASSIIWERLDETSCAAVADIRCANEDASCAWNQVQTGPDYLVDTAGQYRLTINYTGGCFNEFFFNVYENVLNPTVTTNDIICTTPGEIVVGDVPSGYEYSIDNVNFQASNIFSITTAGIYTVYIRQIGVTPNPCIFTVPDIQIRERNFTVSTDITQPLCHNGQGSVLIAANDVRPQYYFSISLGGTLINSVGPIVAGDYTFPNLNPGTYTINVSTDDGCAYTGDITIINPPLLTATAALTSPLTCTDGEITVYPVGGTAPYFYFVNSTTVFQTVPVIPVSNPGGVYNIRVVDSNNCFVDLSITVDPVLPPDFNITKTDILCAGSGNVGEININVTNPNGNSLRYSIDNGATFFNSPNFTGLAVGNYEVVVEYTTGPDVCETAPQTINIIELSAVTGTVTLTTPYTCITNGVITVSGVSGGTGPYTYSIDGVTFQPGLTFTGLTDGTYTVTIRDANNCTFVAAPITIDPLDPPTDLAFSSSALTCPLNVSDVTITGTTGGLGTLEYQITAPAASATAYQASNIFSGLTPGTYTFQVRDAADCTYSESYTIDPLPALSVVGQLINDVTCVGALDGAVRFTVSGSTGFTYTINGGASAAGTSPINLTGLGAGTYTILITDTTTNCQDTASVTVNEPPVSLSVTATESPITCDVDGSVVINATGGWGGNTYTLTLPDTTVLGPQGSNTFANLTQTGTYTVTVTDANGCIVTDTFTLSSPTAPTASIDVTSDLCYDVTNAATLVVTASGGQIPYEYNINGGPFGPGNTFANLTPGNYTIIVRDAYGCTVTLPAQTIAPQLTVSAVLTKDLDCSATPDALITFTVAGGVSPYTYEISVNGGAYGVSSAVTANPFTYLTPNPGDYRFRITDAQGCVAESNVVTIDAITNPTATVIPVDPTCNGAADGSVQITASGGVGPYTYSFNGSAFTATLLYTGLSANIVYPYVVMDSKGCVFNGSVTLTEPTLLAATAAVAPPLSCSPANTNQPATVTVTATPGTGTAPYEYSFNGSGFSATNTLSVNDNGSDQTINYIVRDAQGCTVPGSIVVTALDPPTDLSFGSTPVTCTDITSNVTLTATGGVGPLTYAILSPASATGNVTGLNTGVFIGLAPDTYLFEVRDANGCYYTESYTVDPVINITVSGSLVSDVNCNGGSDGAVSFSVGSFTGTYDYTITGGIVPIVPVVGLAQSGATVNLPGLAVGIYTIDVTDNTTDCTATFAVTVNEPANPLAFTAVGTNVFCTNYNSQITVTATDGTGPYTYIALASGAPAPLPGAYGNSNVLTVDTSLGTVLAWDVYVLDANGCPAMSTINITNDPLPTINPVAQQCYVGSPLNITLVEGTGTAIAPLTYSIGSGFQASPNFVINTPGTYTLTVRDGNGCEATTPYVVDPQLTVGAVLTKELDCSVTPDALITFTVAGGVSPYTYEISVNGGAYGVSSAVTANPFTYLTPNPGDYRFRITDAQGCVVESNVVTIDAITNPTATVTSVNPTCFGAADGSVQITASGGVGPYTYSFNGSAFTATLLYTGLSANIVYPYVVMDSKGCVFNGSVTLTEPTLLAATAAVAPPLSCSPANTNQPATVTVTATPGTGTAPYEYSFNGSGFSGTNTLSVNDNGSDQTINYIVRDAQGCTVPGSIVVTALDPPTALSFGSTPVTCTDITSNVTLTATGGVGPLTYAILSPASATGNVTGLNTGVFIGLAPDTYLFEVRDANGCYYTESYIVDPVTNITVSGSLVNDVNCNGGSDGAVSFSVGSFTGTYDYTITGGIVPIVPVVGLAQSGATVNLPGLAVGIYTIDVTDNTTDCTATFAVTVNEPANPLAFTAVGTNVFCTNYNSQITVTATDGTGPYTYIALASGAPAPLPGAYGNSNVLTVDTSLGTVLTWDVYVLDANGCPAMSTVNITNDPLPTINPVAQQCYVGSPLNITLVEGTGTAIAPLTYSIGSGFQASPNFVINTPGTYTLTVRDGNGCEATTPYVVDPQLQAIAALTKGLDCSVSPDAAIDVNISGGNANYTAYEVSINGAAYVPVLPAPVGASFTYPTSVVGTYEFRITDTNITGGTCTVITNEITVVALVPVTALDVQLDPTCNGYTDGSITLTATAGQAPFTYSIDGGATFVSTNVFGGLGAGVYNYVVRDNLSCTVAGSVTLNNPSPIIANVQPFGLSCTGMVPTPGRIEVSITSGGTANYTYTLLDNTFTQVGLAHVEASAAPTPTHTFGGLSFGDYYVRIVDDNGCEFNSGSIRVNTTPDLLLTGNVDTNNCATGVDYTVTTIGGTGPYNYSILGQPETVGPAVYTFTGLLHNVSYFLQVRDANNCIFVLPIVTPAPPSTIAISGTTVTNVTCNGADDGTFAFTVENYDPTVTDIDYRLLNALTLLPLPTPVNGTLVGPAGGPVSHTITALPPGNYVLEAREATGTLCASTFTFEITQPTQPVSTTVSNLVPSNCNADAQFTLTTVGGTGPYTYAAVIQGAPAPLVGAYGSSNVITVNTNSGSDLDWDVYVLDANGCPTMITVSVTHDPLPTINPVAQQCYVGSPLNITLVEGTGTAIAPLTYSIGSGFQASPNFVINTPGTYTLTVRDGNGCEATTPYVVEPQLLANATLTKELTCSLPAEATIDVVVSGGTTTYTTYEVSTDGGATYSAVLPAPVGATFTYSTAVAGTYQFRITDTNSCEIVTNATTIDAITNPTATVTSVDPTCNGAADGSVQITASGGVGPYTYSFNGSAFTSTLLYTGLSANIAYPYVVRDSKGCEFNGSVTLSEPLALLATAAVAPPLSCSPANTNQPATVTVTATPGTGTAPYEYSFNGSGFSATNTLSVNDNGSDQTINYIVRDAQGCTVPGSIVVTALDPPTDLSFVSPAVTCTNLTSDVTLTATGGVGPLTYAILSPASATGNVTGLNTGVFIGLAPDTYLFEVRDANGCYYTESYTVDPVINITVSGSLVSDVNCNGGSDGAVSFSVGSFTGTYDYTITGGIVPIVPVVGLAQSGATVNLPGLAVGTYTIDVTDNTTDCTATFPVTVGEPANPLAFTAVGTNVFCTNYNSQITVTATDGTGPYTYIALASGAPAPLPGAYGNSNVLTVDTSLGTVLAWDVYVLDANGCPAMSTINITNDPLPTINPVAQQCYVGSPLNITLVEGTGTAIAPLTYSIGSGFQASPNFVINTPGTYTLTVRDGNGCEATTPYVVEPQLLANATLTKELTCSLPAEATIDVVVSGGTTTYTTYEVSTDGGATYSAVLPAPVGATFTYSTAVAGTYQFRITDTNSCEIVTNATTIDAITNPTATVTSVDPTCNGAADGSVQITASGGVGPYTYSFNGSAFTATLLYTGLSANIVYPYVVMDSKGCVFNGSVTLTEPTLLAATAAVAPPLSCSPANTNQPATVTVTATPGTGTAPYEYSFNGSGFSGTNTLSVNDNGSDQTINYIVRDAQGCTVPGSIVVTALDPPTALSFGSTPVTCTDITSNVTLTATGGVGPLTYAILSPASATGNVTGLNTGVFIGLAPDTYLFEVRDANGCYYTESYIVDPVTNITVSGSLVNDVNCNGGSDGAVSFSVGSFTGTYDYTITGGIVPIVPVVGLAQSGATVNLPGLAVGIYTIDVTDNTTDCTATFAVTVNEPANPLAFTAVGTNVFCTNYNSQITVTATDGTGPYTYIALASGAPAPLPGAYGNSNVLTVDTSLGTVLTWDVYVLDANGCPAMSTVNITNDPLPTVTVPVMATCIGGADPFTFTITGSSGVAPLEYSIGTGFQSSGTFTVSTAGTYTVTVRDANGCTATSTPVTVYEPLDLTPVITTLPSCTNDDGVITITPSGGSGGPYTFAISPSPASISISSNVISGVPSGTYTITITDTVTTCISTASVTLDPATPVTFTTSVVDVSCNGGNDGSITVSLPASNDNPVYTYEITAPIVVAPQTSNIFTGLIAGTYTVRVNSGRGCFFADDITVTEPSLLTVSGTATAYTCAPDNSVNTSTLTINEGAGTGTAPYVYSIDGTNYFTTNTFDIIDTGSAQNISIFVRDDNGCIATNTVAIAPLPTLTAATVVVATPIDCNGTGSVAITVTGGSGNFSYQMLPGGTPQASNIFSITAPGDYYFQVNDLTTGCTIVTPPFTVAPFDTIDAVITATTAVTCFTDTNGVFEINVTGYTGPYNYDILDSTGASVRGLTAANTSTNPEVVMGLSGGNYTVVVTETASPFCTTTSNVVTIDSPATPLTVVATETANVTCDNNIGTITAVASGGRGTYEYELTGAATVAYSPNGTFRNLAAGAYTVNVRDAGGCIASDPITLTIPTPISATVTPSTNLLSCFGDTNATITVSLVTGGQGSNYSYSLNMISPTATTSGPQTSPVFTNLGAGTYNVTVTDGYNCVFNSPNIVINEPTQIQTTLASATSQTCLTSSTLTLSATGGTGPYTYSDTQNFVTTLGSFASSTTFPVGVGTHVYYVRDANGCNANVSNEIKIDPLPALTADIVSTNINCAGDNTGSIVATAQGGLGNYVYTLQDASGTNITPVTQNSPGVFTDLVTGIYQVRVDSGDCVFTSATINITEPANPLIASFVTSAVTCPGTNDGILQINASGGTGVIRYAISPRLDQFFETSTFENLAPGTYQVIAQDELGCFVFDNFTIDAPVPVILTIVPNSLIPEICEGDMDGEFSVDISGGVLPYSVALDDINGTYITGAPTQTVFDFTNLGGGDHIVYVRDALGCESEWTITFPESVIINPEASVEYGCTGNLSTNTVTVTVDASITNPTDLDYSLNGGPYQASNVFVNVPAGLDHFIDVRHTNGCIQRTETFDISQFDPLTLVLEDGGLNEIVAVTGGGSEPFEYTLNDESYGSTNTFIIYASGDYTVTVTDSKGCVATATRYFEYIDVCISNYFTPDGDGNLDEWGPGCTSQYKDLTFDIFDRYGREIATLRVGDTWDGKYNGSELPTGDYWYVLKLNDPKDDREFVGHFTLYR
ncbi:T9SS type B sorting domain-containing protein [Flavivirga spongiicola]|uniref:T9SS type B sorting domain-containing protein n=1 Tax=Flavivirga spongiicola TaxID=421621 RepID=A0ABU7XZ68_9FLAO|nr:T9SS type B sorting domain-containing protein [Flavivirga sp. MEBiC05379]MDO5980748.1 T9SS type B sorting domain-containing protein [Flavivirga sp. MEBiC05379]